MTKSLAPVCLFVYKRPAALNNTIASLQRNRHCAETDLYVFSDAAATEKEISQVIAVRALLQNIKGFKSVNIYSSEKNKGLAVSIIEGVSLVIHKHGKVIVVEDDLVLASNFLIFMNAALDFYQFNPHIFSVSGYSPPIKNIKDDVFFTLRGSSWGWGTWVNRWKEIDWELRDYDAFHSDTKKQRRFNTMGSDMTRMLKKQKRGEINSWAIRWNYHQFLFGLFTVFPVHSKVLNDGFSEGATHTASAHNNSRFSTTLDCSEVSHFCFPKNPILDKGIIKQFTAPNSLKTRLLYKVKALLSHHI